tara:strand:- start:4603 stop:5112 length:510 start_codon:yes stop_codon:yes gene_type:complete
MALLILLAFILVPIAEIAVFIQAGELIGLWPTIATVILTAIIGTAMLRQQGIATLMRLRATVDRGEMPLREVFDGACLLVAGILLLTPGFLTDAVGFLLLIPPVRFAIGAGIWHRMQQSGNFTVHTGPQSGPSQGSGQNYPDQGPGPVIDTDYSVIDEEKDRIDQEPKN